MYGKLFIISGIQGDYGDVSKNMIEFVSRSDLLFVEEISIFEKFKIENKINFTGELVELNETFDIVDYKKEILRYIVSGKNIGIFESSGAACFIDPGYEIVDYIYGLKTKIDVDIFPIPGTSALTLAISCSGFDIVSFKFLGFISESSRDEILSSNIPVIYFNKKRSLYELNKYIDFMKDMDNMFVFVGINLGKVGVDRSNILIRGTYKEVYIEINRIYENVEKIDDITFIFK